MFVFSLKANKTRLLILFIFILCVSLALFFTDKKQKPMVSDGAVNYKASDESERAAFLSQFGWEISEDPVGVEEIVIPSEFDETYDKYNQLQVSQGLDLTKYKGLTAKKWTYEVKNYPGYASEKSCIRANIIVYGGAVIAGDISSLEQGGFMNGFDFPSDKAHNP